MLRYRQLDQSAFLNEYRNSSVLIRDCTFELITPHRVPPRFEFVLMSSDI